MTKINGRTVCAVWAITMLPAAASGALMWDVEIADPTGDIAPYAADIERTVHAAAAEWGRWIDPGASVMIDIRVSLDPSISTAAGRSVTSAFLYDNGDFDVWEQGAAAEIRLGSDPNGATHDVEIFLGASYLANELWFDPNGFRQRDVIPADRTDAYSV
ncbi:MAG: hypothetical protein AAFX05_12840, partial [Planctomycetota bacterium]